MGGWGNGFGRFSTLLDIDKLTPAFRRFNLHISFSTLLDIDKLTHKLELPKVLHGFSTLLDIDKLTPTTNARRKKLVLVLCWILINLHSAQCSFRVPGF